ncbi:MAG: efflux RND transporter periplasmic adaptor subunit [Armatimonadota bacterium]
MRLTQPARRRQAALRGRAWVALLIILVLIAAGAAGYLALRHRHSTEATAAKSGELWTCPMHPQIIRSQPGNCPICGMTLVPVQKTEVKTSEGAKSNVPGEGVVTIDPAKQQLIGVVTVPVERRSLHRTVRAVGTVAVDESRLSDVHTKVEGWIEQLFVNKTGELVRKGQPLLTIYSPDLVSTQQEYLVALRSRERTKDSPFAEVRSSGDTLVAAARKRLQLWDITDADIARLERTGEVRKALTLYAPTTGYVMERMAVAGMQVMPSMTLLRIADLSRVWMDVSIYEFEAPLVQVGQQATLTMDSHPGKAFAGRVAYIYPTVEEMTRTLKARLDFANPGLWLKPGMYANVEIMVPGAEQLALPEQAIIDTGTRKVVFVKQGEGTFIPREVQLGPRSAGYYPVLGGVKEGELVVSSPNFLIDSESRFQAAIEAMGQGMSGMSHAGH